ncbi:hypothetical protein LSAT2_032526 [Lamellibrachia satsuma]|nr:hypothetical protein LSAT2_032526 [Lamellibrachia satsuma]
MMTTKSVDLVGLLLYLSSDLGCVRGQPTTDLCNSDTNGRQEALLEQTFHTLQTMNSRLQSIESHLKSFDKWKRSIEQWVKEKDKDTRCQWSVDGNITCYKLVHRYMKWSESRANCQTLGDGADLVSIETQEENEFLLKMIRDLRPHNCPHMFTSGRRDSSGVWKWVATGRPFSYTYWMTGQPDNYGGVEDANTLWDRPSVGLFWNDDSVARSRCSLCEIR